MMLYQKEFPLFLFLTLMCVGQPHHVKGKIGFINLLFNSCKCKCGLPNRESRLLGGEYLRVYEFPWLASIQVKGAKSIPGTLINNKYVITAASSIMELAPFDLKVTLGQFDRCFPDSSSLNVSVESIIIHQEFNPSSRAHDIALLKLSAPVTFEKRISPICLSTIGAFYVGQVATIVGWSTNHDKENHTEASTCRPRKLGLPVLEYNDCLTSAFDFQSVSTDKRCAGIIGAPNLICNSDAGGPVMYRSYGGTYELIGILTDKNDCSDKPSTTLYVTINDHLKWITSNTVDACYCIKSY